MNAFLEMTADRRRLICDQAGAQLNLPAATVEKDFWVCWILKRLFGLPVWGKRLTFKGRTSLSKGWQLIQRFSEDIDVVVDRDSLGFSGESSPNTAPSRKQLKKRLDALHLASQELVNGELLSQLHHAVSVALPTSPPWNLEPDPDAPDKQSIRFNYPTVFPERSEYLRQMVRVELGARSDTSPTQDVQIQPYIAEAFPDFFERPEFVVRAVSPVRTFWEKAMLLHEESFRPLDQKQRKARMARHYYDLYCLITAGIAEKAVSDLGLFWEVARHRQVYFRITWVDYSTLCPGQLRLVPGDKQIALWRADYTAMRDDMFFGDIPTFDSILSAVSEFEDRFNGLNL